MQSDYIIKTITCDHIRDIIWNKAESIMYRSAWDTVISFPLSKLSPIGSVEGIFSRNDILLSIDEIMEEMK